MGPARRHLARWTSDGAREALLVFLGSRLALWLVAAVTVTAFSEHLAPGRAEWDDPLLHDAGDWIDVWARWDSYWFLSIAEDGYRWPSSTPAFFPLMPLAIRAVGLVTAGHLVVAGVIVSLAAGAAVVVVLHRLVERLTDRETARLTIVALSLFPTSLFLGAVYSESLYLLTAVGAFAIAERGRLAAAGLVAGLALLTRAQGVALLPALVLLAWPLGGARAAARVLAPAVLVGGAYPIVLWLWIGRPFAFLEGQDVWERRLSPAGPFGGIAGAIGDGDLFELGFAVLMTALAVIAWRRLGAPYGLYAIIVLAIPMSFPSDRLGGLYSFPRLALAAFPCFVAIALVLRPRRGLTAAYVGVAATLLGVLVVRWSLWQWIS